MKSKRKHNQYKVHEKKKKVTTVFRGKKIVWTDLEEAKEYIPEGMMSSEGEDYNRYAAIYIKDHKAIEKPCGLLFYLIFIY